MKNVLHLVHDTRPIPPEFAVASFLPAPDVEQWVRRTFIDADGPLVNDQHSHLREATIGFLWTDVDASRNGRFIAGQCELMPPMAMGKWQRERAIFQIEQWYGSLPDFLITLHAPFCAEADDASFCALVEHELHHAGQAIDAFGSPKFKVTGEPQFAIRGHDVEQFVGVVARYGAVAADVAEMVAAANRGPSVGLASITMACGTCERRRA